MATIEIPDRLIPEGYELDSARAFLALMDSRVVVPLRRKPRKLKAIVFEVAGEARSVTCGEWFIDFDGTPRRANRSVCEAHYVPLIRGEVYEGDDDAAN